jgi:Skp family chaperone for outer membrane proteins
MKTGLYKVLSLGLLSLGSSVYADTVAVADLYKVVRSLPDLERVQEEMQKDTTVAQGKLNNKKVQLDAKIQEFEANKDTLSEQKMDKIRKEINILQRELKYLEADLREDLAIREQDQKNDLIKQARFAVTQYAVKNKIDVVLSVDPAVYVADHKDITDAVIQSLALVNSSPAVSTVPTVPAEPVKKGKK